MLEKRPDGNAPLGDGVRGDAFILYGRQGAEMSLVREVFMWREDGKMHARLGTNAPKSLLLRRLRELGIGDEVEEITVHDDLLRLNGGNYAIVRWSSAVTAALLGEKLVEL